MFDERDSLLDPYDQDADTLPPGVFKQVVVFGSGIPDQSIGQLETTKRAKRLDSSELGIPEHGTEDDSVSNLTIEELMLADARRVTRILG
jgi:hypothetical protein